MKTLVAYLQLFPTIISSVQALESAVPLPAAGKQKLDLLLGIVKAVYDAEETVRREVPWEKLASLITTTATAVVTSLNTLGLFHHPKAN